MKLKDLCEQVNIPYNSKNPTRSLNAIKKYLIEQNGNKKDYTIVRHLTDQVFMLVIAFWCGIGRRMMRLIDADKLLEETRKDRDYARKNGFLDMYYERQVLIDRIESQPTAYDVDKIVEQLKELSDESYKAYCIAFNSDDRAEYDAYTNAIEIVKGGGADA